VDWLILWLLFGGRRDRYVLVETPEQREERRQREAEALARMATRIGKFLGSGLGMIMVGLFLLTTFPMALDVLTGGNRCGAYEDKTLAAFIKFIARC
jgi:hypothetical protein